ncbi:MULTISPECIES: hypothetical protein [Falsihalocynthiibacter]|uniref:hypothetical protein n=1 Tax=Falsihalocynthiibacter TaxID=2854182 RepID=UPI003003A4FF
MPTYSDAWKPESLNVWIGSGFSIGSFLFIAGSILTLWPVAAHTFSMSGFDVNAVFFLGSIFFTIAGYLQLFQAANSGALPHENAEPRRFVLIGWQPSQIGWLSSFLQFLGTLLFNACTFMALLSIESWLQQDLAIWVPDLLGSILFLTSGYLAFIETCHRYWSWRPWDISWWGALVNFAGCVAFMISAVMAFVPSGGASSAVITASVAWTLIGAVGFFVGAVLVLVECRVNASPPVALPSTTPAL